MTVRGLWAHVRKGNKELNDSLEQLRGRVIGVDAGMFFHRVYSSVGGARSYHQVPHVPLDSAFEDSLNRLRTLCAKFDIKLVFVCDGFSNELKKKEDTRRGAQRDAAQSALRTLYEVANPSEDELATAMKLMKASCKTTVRVVAQLKAWADAHPDDVRVVSALFEADQQLASMCKDGVIDAVLGEDGDFLCNGAPKVITSLDYTSGACQIYVLKDVLLSFGHSFSLSDFQVWCTFCGCDYLLPPLRLKPLVHTLAYRKLKSQKLKDAYISKLESVSF